MNVEFNTLLLVYDQVSVNPGEICATTRLAFLCTGTHVIACNDKYQTLGSLRNPCANVLHLDQAMEFYIIAHQTTKMLMTPFSLMTPTRTA